MLHELLQETCSRYWGIGYRGTHPPLPCCCNAHAHMRLLLTVDNYDKNAHDRLLAKVGACAVPNVHAYRGSHTPARRQAHDFCAKIAAQYPAPSGAGSSAPALTSLPGEVECERGEEEGGNVAFLAHVQWHPSMYKGAKMTADAPPIGTVSFPVPTDGAAFSIKVSAPATVQSLTLSKLHIVPGAAAPTEPTVPPSAEEETDVVERTAREVSLSPTAQAAQAKRDAEKRTSVQSHVQPPILDALAQLGQLGWRRGEAEGKGDCTVLSVMAGHEIKDEHQVLYPSTDTLKLVQKYRSASVSLVVGTEPIGGISVKTFRAQEGLCRTPQAAAKEMKLWRSNRHWLPDNAHESACFLFGIGAQLRPVIVLEQGEGGILDPCRVYAARDANGSLRRSPASKGKPATVPSWFPIRFTEVLATLRKDPSACSVLLYDGTVHFDPILHGDTADMEVENITSSPKEISPASIAVPAKKAVVKELLQGTFTAVYKKSDKTPVGKKLYTFSMAWSDRFYIGCKLTFYVPPIGKTVTTTLSEKPTVGNLTLQVQVPDTVTEDSFALGECHFVVPAAQHSAGASLLAQPLAKAALPTATAFPLPTNTKRAAKGGAKQPKEKKAKVEEEAPPEEPVPEPDFALPGYVVLPPPADVSIATLQDKLIAHRFSVKDWQPGWCVGIVEKQSMAKRTLGQYEVNYGKQFTPSVYIHKLLEEQYGAGKGQNWCLVAKQ